MGKKLSFLSKLIPLPCDQNQNPKFLKNLDNNPTRSPSRDFMIIMRGNRFRDRVAGVQISHRGANRDFEAGDVVRRRGLGVVGLEILLVCVGRAKNVRWGEGNAREMGQEKGGTGELTPTVRQWRLVFRNGTTSAGCKLLNVPFET